MNKSEKIFLQLIEAHEISDTVTARRLGQEYIERAVLEQVKKAQRVAKERNIAIDPERFATKFYCTIIDHFKESGVWKYLVTDQGASK